MEKEEEEDVVKVWFVYNIIHIHNSVLWDWQ